MTPCSFNTIRSRRGDREWTRWRVSVWVAISIGVKRTGVNKGENGDWTDTRLHLPWRVPPWDVTASERLLFYLFVLIWTLSTELLRKGRSGIVWPDLGFLKLEGAGSVCEGIRRVIRVGQRGWWGTASHERKMSRGFGGEGEGVRWLLPGTSFCLSG